MNQLWKLLCIVLVLCAAPRTDEPLQSEHSDAVDQLDNSNLAWHVDSSGQVRLRFRDRAADILKTTNPPLKELLAALKNPKTFLPAHCILGELAYGPGCGLLDDRSAAYFQGVRLTFQPSLQREEEWIATPTDDGWSAVSGNWSFDDKSIEEVLEAIEYRREVVARDKVTQAKKCKELSLANRRRDLVEKIRNADVQWGHSGWGSVWPHLTGDTRAAAEGRLSIEALLDALNDPNRFIAAHVLLCREFSSTDLCSRFMSDGFHVSYNGLRVEVKGTGQRVGNRSEWKWDVKIPNQDTQRTGLVKRWARVVAALQDESHSAQPHGDP